MICWAPFFISNCMLKLCEGWHTSKRHIVTNELYSSKLGLELRLHRHAKRLQCKFIRQLRLAIAARRRKAHLDSQIVTTLPHFCLPTPPDRPTPPFASLLDTVPQLYPRLPSTSNVASLAGKSLRTGRSLQRTCAYRKPRLRVKLERSAGSSHTYWF